MTITTVCVRYRVIKLANGTKHEQNMNGNRWELTAIAITKCYAAAYFALVIVNLRVQRTA